MSEKHYVLKCPEKEVYLALKALLYFFKENPDTKHGICTINDISFYCKQTKTQFIARRNY